MVGNVSSAVAELVESLSREQKLRLVHGTTDPDGTATGYVSGVPEADVPDLRLVDGPLGVRVPGREATAFPASLALAATFDTDLAREQGRALARETKARGQDALLGPGLNLIRVPHGGRNFEYYAEDPVLTAAFAGSVVGGIQSEDVIATPKHYVANNQETDRASVNVAVSERALRECYLPGFEAAVDAGAGSVMTAYNRVDGTHMSDNRRLLTEVLKDEWGFDGYVVSDWFGTESATAAANGGLDMEMPGIAPREMGAAFDDEANEGKEDNEDDKNDVEAENDVDFGDLGEFAGGMPDPFTTEHFGEVLPDAIEAGEVSEERLNDMASRVLAQMERVGKLDDTRDSGALDTPAHRDLARTIAARGTVLLENDGVLPLADSADVAVVGPGVRTAMLGGGGSSETEPFHETATAEGIRERASGTVTVAPGHPEIEQPSFFGGNSGDDGAGGGEPDHAEATDIESATEAATAADVTIVVVRDAATEAKDRESLRLPGGQDELVEAVADAGERTVVVVQSSGPVELPWRTEVDAILEAWYPGQSDGDSLAAVLYGDVDASGRLPVTFAAEEEYPTADERSFPGVDGDVEYAEGVFVGYRYFDAEGVEPTYPFGHGLSFGSYEYRTLDVLDERHIQITVANVAGRAGREVVQAYVRPPESATNRPVREFAGFATVEIPAGETRVVNVTLDDLAFQRYDESSGWTTDAGEYTVKVGRSSRKILLEASL